MAQNVIRPKLLVLGPSGKEGGSGFEMLVHSSRTPMLNADIEVFSKNPDGAVYQRAKRLGIPFHSDPGPLNASFYQGLVADLKADHVHCSGWLNYVVGLLPERVSNIHPAILPVTKGTHGKGAHAKALEAYHAGLIKWSAVHMHFVIGDEEDLASGEKDLYDKGPIFFTKYVPIFGDDDADSLQARANKIEHAWQSSVLELVLNGRIFYSNGKVQTQDYKMKTILGVN